MMKTLTKYLMSLKPLMILKSYPVLFQRLLITSHLMTQADKLVNIYHFHGKNYVNSPGALNAMSYLTSSIKSSL